ncbi:MAG: hypothetical protein KZQ87_15030 [Candidatus Thiodiazotropha sp. (ex Cardiolucina cf. quadrata)]|nr:hypothetical protein [Candidatus Thiodiazotropha sp. (ex Cardiolucina cf. quadrata)]
MAKLRVPSVQHLARHWYDSPKKIEDEFVKMAMNPPTFNYNALNDIARDSLLYKVPEDQIIKGIKEKEKRKRVQKILLEVVPLLHEHFSRVQYDFVNDVAPSFYPIGRRRDLRIPFKSVFIYGIGGQIYLPWLIFWKHNPLDDKQLSLFVTLVREILHQDPDLEEARFQILDFSASNSKECRQLRIIDTADIHTFNSKETAEMLAIFVEGFERAEARLKEVDIPSKRKETEVVVDVGQYRLWDK